ncbi:cation:dicarboxylate symporter family transporter, partial [Staphylococcus saprophyticus]|uniref:cation:dicarboxylate symporter family transporter n=1 Tax=Staphylococcus saprophyticus TaxID=29385 RepID=UPI00289BB87C
GITVGSIFNMFAGTGFVQGTNQYVFNVIGQIFLNLIFMLVVPVVFVSILLGVIGVGDPKLLGGIGLKTVTFFLCTTAIAIIIAMLLA